MSDLSQLLPSNYFCINDEYDNSRKGRIAFSRNQPRSYIVKTEPHTLIRNRKHLRVLPSQSNRGDGFDFAPDLNGDRNSTCDSYTSKTNTYVTRSDRTVKPSKRLKL